MPTTVVLEIDDLVRRLNALAPRKRGRERWDRWSVRRLLEAGGVQLTQRAPRCKFYVPLSALREAFPSFWESLLDAEALAEASDEPLAA